MFSYNEEDGMIKLTRGDTAYLDVCVADSDGKEIKLTEQSEICMTVREDTLSPILFQVAAKDGTIKINPEDTKELEFGTYRYDVQVTLANGDVVTHGPYRFKVLQEVTY